MFEEESCDFRANVEEARMSDILLNSCVVALLQDKCGFAGRDWAAALFMPAFHLTPSRDREKLIRMHSRRGASMGCDGFMGSLVIEL